MRTLKYQTESVLLCHASELFYSKFFFLFALPQHCPVMFLEYEAPAYKDFSSRFWLSILRSSLRFEVSDYIALQNSVSSI